MPILVGVTAGWSGHLISGGTESIPHPVKSKVITPLGCASAIIAYHGKLSLADARTSFRPCL